MEEETQVEEQEAEQKEQEPKEEAKPERKRNDVAELQRRKDREVADARKEAQAATQRARELEGELGEVRLMLKEIREQANITDDDEARIKRLSERERTLAEREKKAADYEKKVAARFLASEYGIPLDDLLEYDDPRDMEIAALKWDRTHRSVDDDEEPEPPKRTAKKEEPEQQVDFDHGGGGRGRVDINKMSDEEFEKYHREQVAAVNRRNLRR